MYQDRGGDDGA